MMVKLEGTTFAPETVMAALEDQVATGHTKEQSLRVYVILRNGLC
jgi:hypothetical protein